MESAPAECDEGICVKAGRASHRARRCRVRDRGSSAARRTVLWRSPSCRSGPRSRPGSGAPQGRAAIRPRGRRVPGARLPSGRRWAPAAGTPAQSRRRPPGSCSGPARRQRRGHGHPGTQHDTLRAERSRVAVGLVRVEPRRQQQMSEEEKPAPLPNFSALQRKTHSQGDAEINVYENLEGRRRRGEGRAAPCPAAPGRSEFSRHLTVYEQAALTVICAS